MERVIEQEFDHTPPAEPPAADPGAHPGGDAPKPKEAKSDKTEEPSATARELTDLRKRNSELEAESRFWAEKAKNAPPAKSEEKAEPDEIDKFFADSGIDEGTAAELLDEIGERGVAALQKRGLVTKSQLKGVVEAIEKRVLAKADSIAAGKINTAKGELTAEAKLLGDYPELRDTKSELSIATAKEFASMIAEDPGLNNYSGLRVAARLAKAQLAASGKDKQGDDLLSRTARIAAQGPTRGSAVASEFEDAGDVEITPEARHLISLGGRYGVDEKTYRQYARKAN